mmetsp:Transcript_28624/g.38167  ORF Transcript_28624/g.38167 Transcript_28624/m.38167 type:complete len:133 (-) Transcript_28624:1700-2098(-)
MNNFDLSAAIFSLNTLHLFLKLANFFAFAFHFLLLFLAVIPLVLLHAQLLLELIQMYLPRRQLFHLSDQKVVHLATLDVIDIGIFANEAPVFSLVAQVVLALLQDVIECLRVVLCELRVDIRVLFDARYHVL